MRVLVTLTLAAFAALLLAPAASAEEGSASGQEQSQSTERSRWDDTGRFYLLFPIGAEFQIDPKFARDTHDSSHEFPGNRHANVVNGGATLGYNFSKHWGIELAGIGNEPDVRSDRFGKLAEYSNISVFGNVRYRYAIGDGRVVPWALAGIGWSLNSINDETTPRFKVTGDGSTVAGTVALGFDYFLNEDVAVGAAGQAFIYPSIDTTVLNKDTGELQHGSNNLTSLGILVHIRFFPGPSRNADGTVREAVYDTGERRFYVFGLAGDHVFFDKKYGGGLEAKSAGSVNWTEGFGFGANLDEHWGVELDLISNGGDTNIMDGTLGKIGEIGVFTVLPTVRYRWQFWRGRLVPYVTAGLGAAVDDGPNDLRNLVDVFNKGPRRTPKYDIDSNSVAGSVGVGVEYFLNHHVSLGLGLPVMVYPDWGTTVQQRNRDGTFSSPPVKSHWNYTGIFPNFRLTVYL